MPEAPTPGQLCYAAYWRVFTEAGAIAAASWDKASALHQAAWEAAAQAVLTHRPTAIELPRCLYCTAYASDTIHLCEEHYRLKETP